VAVAGVLTEANVSNEYQLLAAEEALKARNPCCTMPLSSHAPEPCSSLVSGRPKSSRPAMPDWPRFQLLSRLHRQRD